jgi:hypothetical protein
MKYIRAYLVMSALDIAVFGACTKKSQPQVPSIYGLWKGKYAPDSNSSPSQDVIYRINEDNTLYVYNGADTATAKQKGKSFTFGIVKDLITENGFYANYTYNNAPTIEFAIAVEEIDANYKFFKGVWNYYVNGQTVFGGELFANKVE